MNHVLENVEKWHQLRATSAYDKGKLVIYRRHARIADKLRAQMRREAEASPKGLSA